MKVYLLRTARKVASESVQGVFDSVENAERYAKHFKIEDYAIEEWPVETLKGWKD